MTLSQASNGQPPTAAPGSTPQARDVLVFGDQERVRSVLCRFLARHGYHSIEASSVHEASAVLAGSPVAAILVEITPQGPGPTLDTLDTIRQQLVTGTPTIVMTGATLSDADRERIAKLHAYLFYKPEGLAALIGFLDQITSQERPN